MIWDKVLALGSSRIPLLGGYYGQPDHVIGFYFAKRGAENVATIIKFHQTIGGPPRRRQTARRT
jgi:hypothetical protein